VIGKPLIALRRTANNIDHRILAVAFADGTRKKLSFPGARSKEQGRER